MQELYLTLKLCIHCKITSCNSNRNSIPTLWFWGSKLFCTWNQEMAWILKTLPNFSSMLGRIRPIWHIYLKCLHLNIGYILPIHVSINMWSLLASFRFHLVFQEVTYIQMMVITIIPIYGIPIHGIKTVHTINLNAVVFMSLSPAFHDHISTYFFMDKFLHTFHLQNFL